MKLARQSD